MASPYRSDFVRRLLASSQLTPRQAEVVFYLRKGLTNPDIAVVLRISRHTVGTHLHDIYQKFGVGSRVELVAAVDDLITGEHPPLRVLGSGDPASRDT